MAESTELNERLSHLKLEVEKLGKAAQYVAAVQQLLDAFKETQGDCDTLTEKTQETLVTVVATAADLKSTLDNAAKDALDHVENTLKQISHETQGIAEVISTTSEQLKEKLDVTSETALDEVRQTLTQIETSNRSVMDAILEADFPAYFKNLDGKIDGINLGIHTTQSVSERVIAKADDLLKQVNALNENLDSKTGDILKTVNSGHNTISEAMKTYQTDLIGYLKTMQDDSFGNQKKLIKLSVGLICGVVFLAIEILVLLWMK